MNPGLNRRACLGAAAALTASSLIDPHPTAGGQAPTAKTTAPAPSRGSFKLGFNTSTIRRSKLPLDELAKITIETGYQAMEPWVDELEAYESRGGSLKDLGKKLSDSGVVVPSVIGFYEWIVNDDGRRKQGLEQARRSMELVKKLGGVRIAAPPAGANQEPIGDLNRIAARYRQLLEIGDAIGVVPELEFWGPSKTLSKLSEAAYVMVEAKHPRACILPDVFHLYRGGSGFTGLKPLASSFRVLHFNDYPSFTPVERLRDGDRVYPGLGGAPLRTILTDLASEGAEVVLSLELFNEGYWRKDPRLVARTGFEKMQAIVAAATA